MNDITERLLQYYNDLNMPILREARYEIWALREEAGLKQCIECDEWFGHGKKGAIKRSKFCSTRCKNRWHSRAQRARKRKEAK